MSNPFERYDIDPMQGPAAITARLRELTEDASEAEREVLRAVWEELTLHPRRRLQAALDTFPETRAPRVSAERASTLPTSIAQAPIRLSDLAVIPRVAEALSPPRSTRVGGEHGSSSVGNGAPLLAPIAADPFIDFQEPAK